MRALLLLALLFAAGSACAEWTAVAETPGGSFYLDYATLRKDGDHRRVMQLDNQKQRQPEGELSSIVLAEFDCKGKRSRMLELTNYADPMGQGKVLFRTGKDLVSPWAPIVAGTAVSLLAGAACAK